MSATLTRTCGACSGLFTFTAGRGRGRPPGQCPACRTPAPARSAPDAPESRQRPADAQRGVVVAQGTPDRTRAHVGLGFRLGARVRTSATVRPVRFADQLGEVAVLNLEDAEVGVRLSGRLVWFRPTELRPVSTRSGVAA